MTADNPRIFLAIATRNYMRRAEVLCSALRDFHPSAAMRVLVCDVDSKDDLPVTGHADTQWLSLAEVIPDARERQHLTFRYNALELCCALKPFLARHALTKGGCESVTYLDCDMYLYASLPPRAFADGETEIVLSPHWLKPPARHLDAEWVVGGTFNAGFFSVNNGPTALKFLDYWADMCTSYCYQQPNPYGYLLDQTWLNHAAVYFRKAAHLFDEPGLNVGNWNVGQFTVEERGGRWHLDGSPVALFHWSAVHPGAQGFPYPRHIKVRGWNSATVDCVGALFNTYRTAYESQERHRNTSAYQFATFRSGERILRIDRENFRIMNRDALGNRNPFDMADEFRGKRLRWFFNQAAELIRSVQRFLRNTWRDLFGST